MHPSLRALATAGAASLAAGAVAAQTPLYQSDAFAVTDSSVQQGRWMAVARSRDTLVSTYPRSGREMHFRFSLNGADNEFPSGTEHTLYIRPTDGRIESPLYVFGQEQPPFIPTPEAVSTSEEGVAQVMRVFLRHAAGFEAPTAVAPDREERASRDDATDQAAAWVKTMCDEALLDRDGNA